MRKVSWIPRLESDRTCDQLSRLIDDDQCVQVRQAAITALGEVPGTDSDSVLVDLMDRAVVNKLPPALLLDLVEAVEGRSSIRLQKSLNEFHKARRHGPLSEYHETLDGGDASAGRRVFFENPSVPCHRCHSVKLNHRLAGPPLADVGRRRSRRQLLESIVTPNAAVMTGYEQSILELQDGSVVIGMIQRETREDVELLLPDATTLQIKRSEIVNRGDGRCFRKMLAAQH